MSDMMGGRLRASFIAVSELKRPNGVGAALLVKSSR